MQPPVGTASDSDACGGGSGNGNVNTCIGVSDLGSSKGDAVIPAGTSVTIVCKDSGDTVGIPSKYFNSVPGGLPDCDKALKSA